MHGFPGGYQSVKRYVRKLRGADLPKRVSSSGLSQVKSARSTTGLGRWCAIPTAASIAARGCSC